MQGAAMLTNYKLFDKIAYFNAGADLKFLSRGRGGRRSNFEKKTVQKRFF